MAEYTIEEEDSELAQSIGLNLAALAKQYQDSLVLKAPRTQSQGEQ